MTDLVAYRVTRAAFAGNLAQLLDGEGGRRAAGRWHLRGSPVAYFAESRALCLLERLVHLSVHPNDDQAELLAAKLAIPPDLSGSRHIRRISARELDGLDPRWRQPGNLTCLRIGTLWVREGEHFALQVPSALIPEECNLVVNCVHPATRDLLDVAEFEAAPISIDPRIAEVLDVDTLRRRRSESGG